MRFFRLFAGLGCFLSLSVGLGAQTESLEFSDPVSESRAKILEYIRTELPSSLIERDVQRLRRNVMRLGSFRAEWSKDAREFLVANAALSEWFLYDYSRVQNPELNAKITDVLLEIDRLQAPMGVLAFATDLSVQPRGKKALLPLFEKVMRESPEHRNQVIEFVRGDWGRDVPSDELLYFESQVCSWTGISADRQISFEPGDSLWVRILKSRLQNCRRFL